MKDTTMGMTEDEKRALKRGGHFAFAAPTAWGPPNPLAVRIPEAVRISGLSRSEIY